MSFFLDVTIWKIYTVHREENIQAMIETAKKYGK